MSEMIERALKALEQAEPKFGGPHTFTFSTHDTIRAQRLAMVRAVIEAMRRPLSQQLGEAAAAHGGDRVFWSSLLGDIISDALSEKP